MLAIFFNGSSLFLFLKICLLSCPWWLMEYLIEESRVSAVGYGGNCQTSIPGIRRDTDLSEPAWTNERARAPLLHRCLKTRAKFKLFCPFSSWHISYLEDGGIISVMSSLHSRIWVIYERKGWEFENL